MTPATTVAPNADGVAVTTLADLGWSERWADLAAGHDGAAVGRVVRQDRGWVQVATEDGVIAVRTREDRVGTPVVGDWVVLDDEPDDIEVGAVLARSNRLRRADPVGEGEQVLAANVDAILIVAGLDRPVKDGRLQRAIVQAWDADSPPTIVLTKADLAPNADAVAATVAEAHPGVAVQVVSSYTGSGIDRLRTSLHGTVVLLGESGSGKSSLLNALGGKELAGVGAVRTGDAKGRHTTTRRELHALVGGGLIVDTPGVRAMGMYAEPHAVDAAFADVTAIAGECRFADCHHDREPGCAVTAAVQAGSVKPERLASYRELLAEAEWAQLPEHERRTRR